MSSTLFTLAIYVAAGVSILVAATSVRSGTSIFAAYFRGTVAFYTLLFLAWFVNKIAGNEDITGQSDTSSKRDMSAIAEESNHSPRMVGTISGENGQ